jgi:hypothetical protein
LTGPPGLSFNGSIPFYWMYEQSGRMKEIVRKFLNIERLNEWELDVFRWYIHQWVQAMPSRPEGFSKILIMSEDELRSYIVHDLLAVGIDPL